jgi:uncharacterized protein DUF4383
MNRNPAQSAAVLLGLAFVALGILGFMPGVTTDYSSLAFAGESSQAKLAGLFQVSILYDIVHILIGVAGLGLAQTISGARRYLTGGGVLCLALWMLGIVNGGRWIPVNAGDDWLHLGLGVGLIGLGFATSGSPSTQTA